MDRLSLLIKKLINNVKAAIYYFRRQNYTKAYEYSSQIISLGEKYIKEAVDIGFTDSVDLIMPVFEMLLKELENRNEIILADIFEQQLIPALYDIQNCLLENNLQEPVSYWESNMSLLEKKDKKLYKILLNAKEDVSRNYIFLWASSGDPILKVETDRGMVQLHSGINPWYEAFTYVNEASDYSCKKFTVIGIGMGYHVFRLATAYPQKKITVLENDLEQLRILFSYRDLSGLLKNDNISILYANDESEYIKYLSNIGNDEECIIWYPSVKTVKDDKIREYLENYWININSVRISENLLEQNFSKNVLLDFENIECIRGDFCNKTMLFIAGGPSLDYDIETLKKISNEDDSEISVVCVGKVAKKLIKNNIKPDYIAMTDPKDHTIWQIKGIEECGVPLIALSTVASNVVENYRGKCYIAFQEGFESAEEYARKNKCMLFNTGGSVATFAIDMGIRMGCKKIICVGMDMAFTENMTHASGIGQSINDTKLLRKVIGVNGDYIYTSKTLDMYRSWIEQRISNEKNISFINTSKGAKIQGMKEMPLEKAIIL